MNVAEITINVHRSPGKSNHTGSQFVFKILKMRHKERLGVGSDLVDNSVVFSEDELKLILVGLEFVFLEKNNLGRLRDLDGTNS
jgi:hypothetical protein